MPDPNYKRDEALKSISRSLESIDKTLTKIERNTRRVTLTNTYVDQEPSNGGTHLPERAQAPARTSSGLGYVGPYGDGGHPYD